MRPVTGPAHGRELASDDRRLAAMMGRLALLFVALAAAVSLAACGSAAEPSAGASPSPVPMDQLAARPRDYDGREVSVLASLIEIRGVPILCGALAEIAPDGCAGPRLGVVGPIPDGAMGQTVIATGIFRAERGPAAMVLELRMVRPAGG